MHPIPGTTDLWSMGEVHDPDIIFSLLFSFLNSLIASRLHVCSILDFASLNIMCPHDSLVLWNSTDAVQGIHRKKTSPMLLLMCKNTWSTAPHGGACYSLNL